MHKDIQTAIDITAQASAIPRRFFRGGTDVEYKQDESPVTVADKETEQFIRAALRQRFPGHAILGEEFERETTDSAYEWIIDPIDGTRSFVSGMPLYGMLLARLHNGRPEFGVVRMPELDEVYAGDGTQALRNQAEALNVSRVTELEDAFVYINEGEKLLAGCTRLFDQLCRSGRVRRLCYDCYPHILLASGKVDLVIDFDLKPYDYLPLIPIVEGAGGLITDWSGQPLGLESSGQVLSAATPQLHRQAMALIEQTSE